MRQAMPHRAPSSPTPLPTILRYGIAVLSVAIATGLDFFLLRHVEIRLTPFLFAVAATVWYAGTGPGALAIVLSVLSLNYFFLRPFLSFSPISYADLVYLTFCTFCALAVGWVSAVRRRAEQELRQAREELEAKVVERTANLQRSEGYLAEGQRLSHTGSWVLNVAARETIHWSQETYRLYGFDPERGMPPFEALLQRIHPEDRGRFVDDLERAIRERANYEMIFRAVLPDGTLKYILGIGHPVFNASGDVVEFVGAAMDITERKRAEVELRESEQNYRMLFESIDEGFCTIEVLFDQNEKPVDYRFLQISPSFERQTGIKNAAGRRMREIAPQHEEHWFDIYGRIALTGEPMRFENEAKQLGRWYDVYAFRVEDPKRRRVGILFNDITERKRAEAEARDSERRYREVQAELAHAGRVATMGQLTATIAHEVKQPITAAVTYAEAARRWLSAEPPNFREVDDALSHIVKEGKRAGEVVARIPALIKKVPARKDNVAINDAILEVIALTRAEAANNGVSVRTQLTEGLPRVQGDRVQLQQVLLNLIINAIEAMRDVGEDERELFISTRNEPDGVSVEVRDSGPGFAPETLERVFAGFYTPKPDGLGIGLSICRSIIEAHGGRFWASSNLPRGASFQFALSAIANTAS
jgi:PAS domain S-box-containing protein